jgi:hypothetical protein
MTPLWRMSSGKFAGYRSGDEMYDANGRQVGHFDGRILFSLNGQCIGEVYGREWIGKRVHVGYPSDGTREASGPIECASQGDREPMTVEGWEDSPFFLFGTLGLGTRMWDNG